MIQDTFYKTGNINAKAIVLKTEFDAAFAQIIQDDH
jgi:hypothetical protein